MNRLNYASANWLAHKINNESLGRLLHLIKGRVVDLGCGTAPYKADILEVATEYIGVDWANSLHDKDRVDVFADLCVRLPFSDECADTITCFQVMEHIPEPDFLLSEIYRIVKSGGHLLATVPFMWHVHEDPHDYFRYTRFGLTYLLNKNGFIDINIMETTGFWQMWVLKFNYHLSHVFKGPSRLFVVPLWWLGQMIAPVLDRYGANPRETGGYALAARKP